MSKRLANASADARDEYLTPAVKRRFRKDLLRWFAINRRAMPWRVNRTPYRVWISELMLQQTRVDQATPYFVNFMKLFPTVRALAAASRGEVLKAWEGLGYYRRAANAHETARQVVDQYGGTFPATYEGLLALRGIGPYTAAAVASLAYGLDHAVLDGNVIRVIARVFTEEGITDRPAIRKQMQKRLDALLPLGQAADFNESMMELGALVCTPKNPACDRCPLARICLARKAGCPERYPVRQAKKSVPHRHVGAGIIINDRKQILLARRKDDAMLGGLWEFPGGGVESGETVPDCIRRELREELGITVKIGPHMLTVRHAFSHFTMDLHAHWVRITRGKPSAIGCSAFKWVEPSTISDYPLPRADQKIRDAIGKVGAWPVF